jgi:putative lipoic acid-binding regulatory protein
MEKTTLLEFPCQFPIKIIGSNSPTFLSEIKEIIVKHFPDFNDEVALSQKMSQENKYMAISIEVLAKNQETLDEFYKDVCKHPDIKMVL